MPRTVLRLLAYGVLWAALVVSACARPAASEWTRGSTPGVELRLESPETIRRWAPASVPLRLVVRNAGERTISMLTGREPWRYSFVVADTTGRVVWTSLVGYRTAVGVVEYLAPGDSLVFRGRWDRRVFGGGRIPAGTYHVWGVFRAGPIQIGRTDGDSADWTRSLPRVEEGSGGPGVATRPQKLVVE